MGYAPEIFYSLTLREWLHALREHRISADEKTQSLLGHLCALTFNMHRGKNASPMKPVDFMGWMKRDKRSLAKDMLAAFKAHGAREKKKD